MEYNVVDRVPTVTEHRQLAELVGWAQAFRWAAIPASLAASCCGTVVEDENGNIVAMGRVVGDGAFFFYAQDIAVHPDHRRRGLGRTVVERLSAQVSEMAGGNAFFGLFSTPEAEKLYRDTGFGPEAGMRGMWQVLRPGQGRAPLG